MAPLVAVPHTTMCMGVDVFTEENRCPLHVGTYISLLDVTVCKVYPVILHGVVSPGEVGLTFQSTTPEWMDVHDGLQ